MGGVSRPVRQRFLLRRKKFEGDKGCWPWPGARGKAGYGRIYEGSRGASKTFFTHRLSWELHNNMPVPEGLCVLHTCDNPPCINPAHLYVGTQNDNVQDREHRGRTAHGAAYPHFRLTGAVRNTIIGLYENGLSTRQVAKRVGLGKSRVAIVVKGKRSRSVAAVISEQNKRIRRHATPGSEV